MRKIMYFAMGLLCLCITSCSSKIEDAYIAECQYKYFKSIGGYAAAAQYEAEFMELYTSMNNDEREEYKAYRNTMEMETIEMRTIERKIKSEARSLLDD